MISDSPCLHNCQLNSDGTYCISCLRSVDEITNWESFSNEKKKFVIEALKQRKL